MSKDSDKHDDDEILTHRETLVILSRQARSGSVTAACALARELRAANDGKVPDEVGDAIDRILTKT